MGSLLGTVLAVAAAPRCWLSHQGREPRCRLSTCPVPPEVSRASWRVLAVCKR